MNTYSIGEVAQLTGLTTYTLRYYEKEGLLPSIRKNSSGVRRYNEQDLAVLEVLECLKSMGLPLREIKKYLDLRQKGDETLYDRLQIFLRHKKRIEDQMEALKSGLEKINFKIKYFEAALQSGEKDVYVNHNELKLECERLFKHK